MTIRRCLTAISAICFVGTLVFAQTETEDTSRTVNVQAVGNIGGTIANYLTGGETPATSVSTTCFDDNDATDNADVSASSDDSTYDDDYVCLGQILAFTGLLETLSAEGSYTLFAPIDSAFENLANSVGSSEFATLLGDSEQLTTILNYHLVNEAKTLSDLFVGTAGDITPLTTLEGSDLTLEFGGVDTSEDASEASDQQVVRVLNENSSTGTEEAFVVGETVRLDNGVVIGIDSVLMPPSLETQ
jgi:uncharacterized surface protein with fasciclin (FAS1) repeats